MPCAFAVYVGSENLCLTKTIKIMSILQADKKPYLIAECAYSYEGDENYLRESIKRIAESDSANAVKFHILLDIDTYACRDHEVYDLLRPWLFSTQKWEEIIDFAKGLNLDVIILADDLGSLPFLKSIEEKLSAIEIHACSLNDTDMLARAAEFKIPVILGIGGSTLEEISFSIDFLKGNGKDEIILMYGFQNFPTRYEYINFRKMEKLKKEFVLPMGYADHTAWDNENQELITLAGFLLSDGIIEKHFVLRAGDKRTDAAAAVSAEDFKSLTEKMKILQKALGSGSLELNKYELDYGKIGIIKKTIVAARDIAQDEEITEENIAFKRTSQENGAPQKEIINFLGKKAKVSISKDQLITANNIY